MKQIYFRLFALFLSFLLAINSSITHAKEDESNVHVVYVTILPYQTTFPVFFETIEDVDKIEIHFDNEKVGQTFLIDKIANVKLRFDSFGVKEIYFRIYAEEKFVYAISTTINIPKGKNVVLICPPTSKKKDVSNANIKSKFLYNADIPNKRELFSTNNQFINDVIPIVSALCEQYTLPSSVIIAMAILESGYGTSELAINANNYFGLKDWSVNHDDAFFYDKQEEGNWYKRFDSKNDCIQFFIEEVLLHQNGKWKKDYTNVAKDYQINLSNGITKEKAAMNFVEELIENRYSTLPLEEYSKRISRIVLRHKLYLLD